MNKVTLIVDRVWTKVVTDDDNVHKILDVSLSFLVKHRFFVQSYKMKLWDGKHRFYDLLRNRFLTGFLDLVTKELKKRGYIVEIIDSNNVLPKPIEIDKVDLLGGIDKVRFDTVQLPVMKEMLKAGRCVLRLATGSGKSEVIAGIAKVLSDKNVLILVHRVELLQQMIERLEKRLGDKIGKISSNEIDIQRITVGMVMSVWSKRQTLRKYLKEEVEVVISDETHRAGSTIWSKVLQITNAKYRMGVSGTPIKGDEVRDMLLIGLTGKVIEGLGVMDLVEAGYAVAPKVKFINTIDRLGRFDLKGFKYNNVYDAVYNNEKLMDMVVEIVKKHKGSGIVIFTERVEVCLKLFEFLKRSGINVGITYGGFEDNARLNILEDFKNKNIDVLVTTVILDEGVDVPSISGVIFMTSGKSLVRILQRVGRGVRKEDGKDSVIIYDFVVDAPYLKKHALERAKIYEKERFDIEII